jgi:hypothetical protein
MEDNSVYTLKHPVVTGFGISERSTVKVETLALCCEIEFRVLCV